MKLHSPNRFSLKASLSTITFCGLLGAAPLAFSFEVDSLGAADDHEITDYWDWSNAIDDPVMASIQTLPTMNEVPFFSPEPATCPTTSHPFSTMLCSVGLNYDQSGTTPIDIKRDYGYVEKEFFQSGTANVYDLDANDRAVVRTSGHPYTTRLLVRYPANPAKFNGRVFIDILNASSGLDLEDTWRRSWEYLMNNGWGYIGITSKSLTGNALKKFDPVRYAEINWQVNGVDENGLFWDMLSQLGSYLRHPQTSKGPDGGILGGLRPRYVFLGGQSQSGFYMNTYITAFTDRLEKAGRRGTPLFDGYLNLVGPGAMPLRAEPANKVPSVSVPKTLYRPTSVPQIVIMSEAESRFYDVMKNGSPGLFPAIPPYTRRADSNTATDKMRFYEVAGAPHADPTSPIIPINSEIAKINGTGRVPKAYFTGHEEGKLHLDEFVSGAIENMYRWAARGIPAPAADAKWMFYDITTDAAGNPVYDPKRDYLGNALGGLRSPLIEAPLYQYFGMGKSATGADAFDWGSAMRLSNETINGLYNGSCTTYLARYDQATIALIRDRYIIRADGEKLMQLGRQLATTGNVTSTVNYGPVAWYGAPCN